MSSRERSVIKLLISEVFTGQYTDVWSKFCRILCLHNVSLLHVFDNHIQNISYRISTNIFDIGIFVLPDIGIVCTLVLTKKVLQTAADEVCVSVERN